MNTNILSFVKNKKGISLEKDINTDTTIIIDFFNIYCSIVKFNKYKTFTRESFVFCIKMLINKFKDYKVIIVSKNVFEIELEYIINLTILNKNITYIIVEDTHLPKGKNRERDDYVCFLLQSFLSCNKKQQSIIISNDRYKNYTSLISNAKTIKLNYYFKGNMSNVDIDNILIKEYSKELKTLKGLITSKFTFT